MQMISVRAGVEHSELDATWMLPLPSQLKSEPGASAAQVVKASFALLQRPLLSKPLFAIDSQSVWQFDETQLKPESAEQYAVQVFVAFGNPVPGPSRRQLLAASRSVVQPVGATLLLLPEQSKLELGSATRQV